jgi:hypothetical protein
VSIAPSPDSRLYAQLRQLKHGADVAPLQVKLPPDVALIVLRPELPAGAFSILQDGTKRIAFRFECAAPVRPKASPSLNALSFLASNQRSAAP